MLKKSYALSALSLSLCFSSIVLATPSLMLFPTRVVLEKNKRAFQVDLTNTGTSPGTYRITLENRRMTEDGKFVSFDKPLAGELTADQIVQYSPRQVTLAPGAGQIVRLVVRKPADLAEGEYRSHLVFTRLPDASDVNTDPAASKKEVGVKLTPMIGASIPVIVEHGDTSATPALKDLKYVKATPTEPAFAGLKIERTGNRSVYGDLTVAFAAKGSDEKEIGTMKGLAVYSPYPMRKVQVLIQEPGKPALTGGKLTVRFNETKEAGAKLLSEASIEIP